MSFIKNNKQVIGFLVKLGLLCGLYFLWFKPNAWTLPVLSTLYSYLVHFLLVSLTETSLWILHLLNYEAVLVNLREIDMYDLEFNVHVKNYCLGIDMMFALTALIISFPGKWRDRVWFIPVALLGVHAINVGRVVALCVTWVIWGNNGPFDHHDVYNLLATIFIFISFVTWVNKYKKESTN